MWPETQKPVTAKLYQQIFIFQFRTKRIVVKIGDVNGTLRPLFLAQGSRSRNVTKGARTMRRALEREQTEI